MEIKFDTDKIKSMPDNELKFLSKFISGERKRRKAETEIKKKSFLHR